MLWLELELWKNIGQRATLECWVLIKPLYNVVYRRFCRSRIRQFKKVLVVILCYISNIKFQMERMGRGYVLESRDQDRKLRDDLLYTAMGGVRWFKAILVVVL